MDIETRKKHLFNTVKAHSMKHPADAILFIALYTDDGINYHGPSLVSDSLPKLIALLHVAFQESDDFKTEFLAALDHVI